MKQRLIAAIVLVAAVVITPGCSLKSGAVAQGTDGKKPAVQVAVQQVKRMEINRTLVLSGEVQPAQAVEVGSKISGKVASVPVDVGSRVSAGDVLFRLDDSEISAQFGQAEAAVEVARANLDVAEKNKENAAAQLERYRQLYEQGAISADAFDTYKLKYEQAASQAPEALLRQSEANLAYQNYQRGNTVVRSPIAGVVALRNVEPGEMVSPSTQAIRVVDLSAVKVKVNIGEKEVGKVREGQTVDIRVPSAGQAPFQGVVSSVSPSADQKSKTYPVEVRLENREGQLKEGMFAEVTFVVEGLPDALAVPVEALVPKGDKQVVFVLKGDQVEERAVDPGISDGKFQAVPQGLAEGERVVIKGLQGLADGTKVAVPGAGQGGQPKQGSSEKASGNNPGAPGGQAKSGDDPGGPEPAAGNKE